MLPLVPSLLVLWGSSFSNLSSGARQGRTCLLQPAVLRELPLGWGPTNNAVIPRVVTGRWLHGGRQHPHTQGTMLGKFLGTPPMAPVPQLCQQISAGVLGPLCTALPTAPLLHLHSPARPARRIDEDAATVGRGCPASPAPVGSTATSLDKTVPRNHSALTSMRSLFMKQCEKLDQMCFPLWEMPCYLSFTAPSIG